MLSAYSVETEAKGFAPCWWPATTKVGAERMAKHLSEQHANDPTYPNAFWVVGEASKSIGKWYKGQRYERAQVI